MYFKHTTWSSLRSRSQTPRVGARLPLKMPERKRPRRDIAVKSGIENKGKRRVGVKRRREDDSRARKDHKTQPPAPRGKAYPCLDPELVGLGWTEIEYTFEGMNYVVYTSPYGLRCRSLEKAREMEEATRDLELTCCVPIYPRKRPSTSRDNLHLLTHYQCRDLLARYTKRTYAQVKRWKHSKPQMIERLRKLVDARWVQNRDMKRGRDKKRKQKKTKETEKDGELAS